jgi:hypothetical protein
VVGNHNGYDCNVSLSIGCDVRRQITASKSFILITFSNGY